MKFVTPLHLVVPLSALPTLNLMGVIQYKYAPSQAFPACCPLQSLPKLHLLFLSRSSSRCYESPKKEQVSHAFKHLIANIKSYNADKI